MNQYTVEMYNKGWLKGCPKCSGAGELTVDKQWAVNTTPGVVSYTIYGRKCMECGYECSELIWDNTGKEWNGEFYNDGDA